MIQGNLLPMTFRRLRMQPVKISVAVVCIVLLARLHAVAAFATEIVGALPRNFPTKNVVDDSGISYLRSNFSANRNNVQQYTGNLVVQVKWKSRSSFFLRRLDTLAAAELQRNHVDNYNRNNCVLESRIGFLGHSGLLLASTVLVMLAKLLWKTLQQQRGGQTREGQNEQRVGVMDRCPWPFIFTHDPVQGLKDTPTWVVVTWLTLWRVIKFSGNAKVI